MPIAISTLRLLVVFTTGLLCLRDFFFDITFPFPRTSLASHRTGILSADQVTYPLSRYFFAAYPFM
jgi:hypothetical protein